jgi:hypothetical protein
MNQDMHLGHSRIQNLCQLCLDLDGHVVLVNCVDSALQVAEPHTNVVHLEAFQWTMKEEVDKDNSGQKEGDESIEQSKDWLECEKTLMKTK